MSAPVPDPATAPALRAVLDAANYSEGGLMVALGGALETDPGSSPVQSRLLGSGAQAVLARLFLLRQAVLALDAAEALAEVAVEDLVEAGWLEASGEMVSCPFQVTPHQGLLLVHDPLGSEQPSSDIVLGLSSAADTLASLTPRTRVDRALDVGTGCGVHALLAAGHAREVVATDINPRALAFTDLSAALSGVRNVETRSGSFYDPVAGERFDLVISNPPYVISPEAGLTYRDGELGRDEVSRLALTGAAGVLAPGGLAQVLVNWIHQPFESWVAPLERWLADSGCDALLLHHLTEGPVEYAAKWNAYLGGDPDALGSTLDRWVEHFQSEGALSLATGAVTLRRTTRAQPLMVHQEMETAPRGQAGEHVVRLLDAAEWLAEVDDETLLRTPLRIVDGHRLISERVHAGGAYGDDTISLVLDDSAGLGDTVGPGAAAVLMGIEAGHVPADALAGLASSVEAPTDPQELVADMTRALVAHGVLVRA